ncbi:hypothetical protein O6P43_026899 [Quillaja saponaria]|uniref:Uncharacterized protein n=1 Tax=Quillaja saponaria TaxID=32244 RepID=A0AAD7L3M7_QUISA|nr:hypothetical protein O6P43_026899 [Quillaja saponaria]
MMELRPEVFPLLKKKSRGVRLISRTKEMSFLLCRPELQLVLPLWPLISLDGLLRRLIILIWGNGVVW